MIQLTKGTNVLDINLSDYSGAGQDVVQNGSFDDIGSDLILNGDFAEIGSDLVTNGDFSAAGINLVDNPNFTDTGSDVIYNGDFADTSIALGTTGSGWTLSAGLSEYTTFGGDTAVKMTRVTTTNQLRAKTDVGGNVLTFGASYKLTYKVLENNGVTSFRVYYGSSSNLSLELDITQTVYFTNAAANSVLQFINDTDNSDITFTDIVVEELGADWTITNADTTHYVEFVETGARYYSLDAGVSALSLNQLAVPVSGYGKSYKLTCTCTFTSGTNIRFYSGSLNVGLLTEGVNTLYFVADSNQTIAFIRNANTLVDVTISSISVQELGEGWSVQEPTGQSVVFSNNQLHVTYDSTATQGSTGVSQVALDFDTSYKITIDVAEVSGQFKVQVGQNSQTINTTGIQTFYKKTISTAGGDTLYVVRLTNALSTEFKINSITVQEVGQDWTFGDGWGMGEDKAIYDGSAASYSWMYQNIGSVLNNSYKITFDAVVTSGSFQFKMGSIDADASGENFTVSVTNSYEVFLQSGGSLGSGIYVVANAAGFIGSITNIIVQQLDTNNRWVTFADPDSKSVMKLGQVDLEIDTLGHDCGVYQTGLIKPNKLYIITINMKATAAINVEIAASLGTAVSAVIGTTLLTTSYVEYSFEYVTPFAVDHDLQIHRLFGTGADQTISIDYVSMNGVDESKWINDPTWNPFATSLVFVPTLTDESTNNSKQFTLFTAIAGGGWNGRSLHGQVIINQFPTEAPAAGIINLQQPDFLEGFYQVEIRGYLGTFYRILGKGMAHLERASTEDGYNRFEAYNDSVTYKAYEE
jgi:hypothetical protein